MTKAELRKRMIDELRSMTDDDRSRRSTEALSLLVREGAYVQASTMFVFLSMRSEPETDPLIARALSDGKQIVVPKIDNQSNAMTAVVFTGDPNELAAHPKGFREPKGEQLVKFSQIDLALVPGLAFDEQGNRLGRGGGYYDRFLSDSEFHGISCGYSFHSQLVNKIIVEPHDQSVDMLITDERALRFTGRDH